jgi:hypothetical protein
MGLTAARGEANRRGSEHGSTPLRAALAISLVFLSATCAFSQGQRLQQINAAVKACVEVVNAGDDLLSHLEAYYDPAAGKVYYNVAPTFNGVLLRLRSAWPSAAFRFIRKREEECVQ